MKEILNILEQDPFILSDTHFFHDRAFNEFEPVRKSFASSREEFDERMIEVLQRSTPLLHLGDVTIDSRNPKVSEDRIRWAGDRLRGIQKILLVGNHDREGIDLYRKTGWHVVSCGIDLTTPHPTRYEDAPPFILWTVGGRRVFFSHEPVLNGRERTPYDPEIVVSLGEWFDRLGADLNVHGHIHSAVIPSPLFVNVSVEVLGFAPARVSQIVKTSPHPESD